MLLEICVDSLESAMAAVRGGAQRLEVCSALSLGGVTPSSGLILGIRQQSQIEISVLIRPRAGDFVYTGSEFATMQKEILHVKQLGVESVALGILDINGNIDVKRTAELVKVASPMKVTYHRAFDMTPDPFIALEQCIACGVDRILTSGGAARALDSLESLSQLCLRAQERVVIMPGGGINARNISEIATKTNATEFHAGLKTYVPSPVRFQKEAVFLGQDAQETEKQQHEQARIVVLEEDVRALMEKLREAKEVNEAEIHNLR